MTKNVVKKSIPLLQLCDYPPHANSKNAVGVDTEVYSDIMLPHAMNSFTGQHPYH